MGKELGLTGKDLVTFAQDRDKTARDERQKEREHQRELKELEVQKAAEEAKAKPIPQHDVHSILKKSHFPSFDDKVDEIDCYLKRFERFVETMGYPRDKMAVLLSTVLKGKSLNYDRLKSALLKSYNLNADGFRRKFRNSKLDSGETYN
ncbi:hypothetical protein HOLleu_10211 [Holothuria leucospilota]|uniref:Uncharacterized protein n=1 Tax=Holothuria leucospilota TaxID=206669 RepID=A0A9Q1CCR2_HOLLE|nr:hypothetical protein HOLleu_10211 [Holothuria leucospilota]